MKESDLIYEDLPKNMVFLKSMEPIQWEVYQAKSKAEEEAPFETTWYKYVYWIPTIKKELYLEAVRLNDAQLAIDVFCLNYGMDVKYFMTNYKHIVDKVRWIVKNNKVDVLKGESI